MVCDDLTRAIKVGERDDVVCALSRAIEDLEAQVRVLQTMRELASDPEVPPELLISVRNSYEGGRLDN